MTRMVVSIKVMPDSIEVDLESLKQKVKEIISAEGGEVGKESLEPVAFGLKALILVFVINEDKGTDPIENKISELEEVSSAQVIDMRRAMG